MTKRVHENVERSSSVFITSKRARSEGSGMMKTTAEPPLRKEVPNESSGADDTSVALDHSNNIQVSKWASFSDLPTEIIRQIFLESHGKSLHNPSATDLCTPVCLALTCVRNWIIFKDLKLSEGPISLDSSPPDSSKLYHEPHTIHLAKHLIGWMGSKYRLADLRTSHDSYFFFLSKEVYEDESATSTAQRRLQSYLDDWESIVDEDGFNILPHPRGMGDDWFPAAIRVLQEQIKRWPKSSVQLVHQQERFLFKFMTSNLARVIHVQTGDVAVDLEHILPYDELFMRLLLEYDLES